ncbi:dynein heavy chain 6, axonemal-like, partial [Anneissia japonica]|uniref:dynein heavy chain 6, axonemal-like n=1 Tax=Anneissia japonica TaxID=1529436 RepID=UPI0014259342
SVANLVPDVYFDAFTRPIINGKLEEKTAGEGPSLMAMFEDDKHLQGVIQSIRDCIMKAFEAVKLYADTFEPFREFYRENEGLDLNEIQQDEHDVEFFAEALERYHMQHSQAEAIRERRSIGMLLVNAEDMKSKLIPSPLRCLD